MYTYTNIHIYMYIYEKGRLWSHVGAVVLLRTCNPYIYIM